MARRIMRLARRRRLLAIIAAGFAVAAAAWVILPAGGMTVGPAGGVLGAASGPAQVDVPADAVDGSATVNIGFAEAAPAPSQILSRVALPIGRAVQITTSRPLPGTRVRMPFDPARQLPSRGGRRPGARNAFIAIYSPAQREWVPLDTRFDSRRGQLVAVARISRCCRRG
jgi:hypothetical protein